MAERYAERAAVSLVRFAAIAALRAALPRRPLALRSCQILLSAVECLAGWCSLADVARKAVLAHRPAGQMRDLVQERIRGIRQWRPTLPS
jgi:hypothetical protein